MTWNDICKPYRYGGLLLPVFEAGRKPDKFIKVMCEYAFNRYWLEAKETPPVDKICSVELRGLIRTPDDIFASVIWNGKARYPKINNPEFPAYAVIKLIADKRTTYTRVSDFRQDTKGRVIHER